MHVFVVSGCVVDVLHIRRCYSMWLAVASLCVSVAVLLSIPIGVFVCSADLFPSDAHRAAVEKTELSVEDLAAADDDLKEILSSLEVKDRVRVKAVLKRYARGASGTFMRMYVCGCVHECGCVLW